MHVRASHVTHLDPKHTLSLNLDTPNIFPEKAALLAQGSYAVPDAEVAAVCCDVLGTRAAGYLHVHADDHITCLSRPAAYHHMLQQGLCKAEVCFLLPC